MPNRTRNSSHRRYRPLGAWLGAAFFLLGVHFLGAVGLPGSSACNGANSSTSCPAYVSDSGASALPWGARTATPEQAPPPDWLGQSNGSRFGSPDTNGRDCGVVAQSLRFSRQISPAISLAGLIANSQKRLEFRLLGQKPSGVS